MWIFFIFLMICYNYFVYNKFIINIMKKQIFSFIALLSPIFLLGNSANIDSLDDMDMMMDSDFGSVSVDTIDAGSGAVAGFMGIGFLLFMGFIFLISLVALAFWIWMLVDLVKFEKDNNLVLWLLLMLFFGVPVSIIYYFFIKRPRDKEVRVDNEETSSNVNSDVNNNSSSDSGAVDSSSDSAE